MLACKCAFLLVAVFQVTFCQQPPPPKCLRPPPAAGNARPHQCCKVSPIIKMEDLEACGFTRIEGPPPREHPPRFNNCSRENCLLKNLNLAKEDGETLNPEAVSNLLDKWGEVNPGFEKGLEASKKNCLGNELPGPPGLCAMAKVIFCISNTLILNCPKWEETEECQAMRNHLEECKEYFP